MGILQLTPQEMQEMEEATVVFRELIIELTEKEQFVINRYFGLDELGPATLTSIGNLLGLTTARISQIKSKALRKLRLKMRRNIRYKV